MMKESFHASTGLVLWRDLPELKDVEILALWQVEKKKKKKKKKSSK